MRKLPFRWASIIGWVSAAGHSKQMISRGRWSGCARFPLPANTWAHGGSVKLKCCEDDTQCPYTPKWIDMGVGRKRERSGSEPTRWLNGLWRIKREGNRRHNATCLRWSKLLTHFRVSQRTQPKADKLWLIEWDRSHLLANPWIVVFKRQANY